jgi:hypothetical protein
MEPKTDPVRERIERAAEGLVYSSESPRPFEFRRFPAVAIPVTRLSATELASLAGARGGDVQEITLDELLARHIERADALDVESQRLVARYEALRDAIRESLSDVRVVRHGRNEVRCFVLGNDPDTGEIAGVETVSVERSRPSGGFTT